MISPSILDMILCQVVDRKWEIVSPAGPQDNEPKEINVCYLEDSQVWSLYSNCVSHEVLVARIQPDTRALKHAKGLLQNINLSL